MFVVVEHDVSNPPEFWESVRASMAKVPSSLTLHQVYPSEDGKKAVCLWEADKLEDVRDFIEKTVGEVSDNIYFSIEQRNAIGLPRSVL